MQDTKKGNSDGKILEGSSFRWILFLMASYRSYSSATPTQLLRIRELLNLETENRKLINMIFFGQLEFLSKIRTKRFKNLRQRVAMSYMLNPLNLGDTGELIKHRLRVAGSDGNGIVYTKDAIRVVHEESMGLPRDICKLCAAALLSAFTNRTNAIGEDIVRAEAESMPIR